MENRNLFSNPKDAFLSKGSFSEEMASHFFITSIDGCLKYKIRKGLKQARFKFTFFFIIVYNLKIKHKL